MNILVTGAAGYIGSVVTERLLAEGYRIIALDNLKKGHRQAVAPDAHFIHADLSDTKTLEDIFRMQPIEGVVHLAADSLVGESMTDPQKYFDNNVVCGLNLLNVMIAFDVKRLIFSSSAAVYGTPERVPIVESASLIPINPYGESKLIFEKVLRWYGTAYGLNSISLRYFNAAGASPAYGEHHSPETHLIPNVIQAAFGKIPGLPIFGTDYKTNDGTCERDYVHVVDIADAHVKALKRIDGAGNCAYNLGAEIGCSVYQVVKITEKVTGRKIPIFIQPRRYGDPPVLVASSGLARKELDWKPSYPELEDIIVSAVEWQKRFPEGYSY
jgi:UDP-glucose 4-epimerase